MASGRVLSRFAVAVLLAAQLLAPGAGRSAEQQQPRRPEGRLAGGPLVRTEVTSCLQSGVSPMPPAGAPACDGVILLAGLAWVSMHHFDAVYNCCTDVAVVARLADGTIGFRELESGDPCHCSCTYDLAGEVSGLAPGSRAVEVRSSDGELLCAATVELPAVTPEISFTRSACFDPAQGTPPPEGTTISVHGSTVQVEHRGALLSCCLDLAVELEREPGLLRLREVDRAAPCGCQCVRGVFALLPEVAPGSYRVELVGVDGQVVAGADVQVPGR